VIRADAALLESGPHPYCAAFYQRGRSVFIRRWRPSVWCPETCNPGSAAPLRPHQELRNSSGSADTGLHHPRWRLPRFSVDGPCIRVVGHATPVPARHRLVQCVLLLPPLRRIGQGRARHQGRALRFCPVSTPTHSSHYGARNAPAR
jgi:hypothetical protein